MEKHSHHHLVDHNAHPLPADFDNYLPWACFQLSVDATVIVTRRLQCQYESGSRDRGKRKIQSAKSKVQSERTISETGSLTTGGDNIGSAFPKDVNLSQKPVYIETVYNDRLDLVQIKFQKNSTIPRTVMKIIGLLIPYQKTLTSLIINSGLNAEGIHEIGKFLPTTSITDVCLDGTVLDEANYHILLNQGTLKYLSLSKCKINDDVVETIAAKLIPPCPASKSLSVLNLATNRITDVGANYLANVLRYNRQLAYLNLSDNMITDDGTSELFEMLLGFPLTNQEIIERNQNRMEYIRAKNELINKTVREIQTGDFDNKSKRKATKVVHTKKKVLDKEGNSTHNVEQHYYERALSIVEDILGPYDDPFSPEQTETREHKVYCYGNNTLAYLNLAYNNLTYSSLKKLCDVVMTQSILHRKPQGLINVRIEGNYIPESCTELEMIDNLLESGLAMKSTDHKKRFSSSTRRLSKS